MQQSAEYFCSLEHRLKRFSCLGEAGKQSELAFCLFFVALDVVELCMMVRVMQFFLFYFFTLSCTATHLESFRDFNSLHSASNSAKTKQKEKV